MAIVTKPVTRIMSEHEARTAKYYQECAEQLHFVTAQRDALRSTLAAVTKSLGEVLADVRNEGGYSTDEQQQRRMRADKARRDAEALVVETGGKL